MADTRSSQDRNVARNRAENHFAASQRRDLLVREEIARDRAATDAKTAKLRALRLEKEEAERNAAEAAPPKPKAPRARKRTINAG